MTPNKSPEPTAVGAGSSAIAVHAASRRWLSFFVRRLRAHGFQTDSFSRLCSLSFAEFGAYSSRQRPTALSFVSFRCSGDTGDVGERRRREPDTSFGSWP